MSSTFSNGLSWYLDRAFLKGDGAGKPLGVLNSPCLISQAKEDGQTAATICYENLAKMLSRLHSACFPRSVWVAHPTTIPQLLALGIAVGDGGSAVPVMKESSGKFSKLTRPVIFSEKMETLGSEGDIMLADFSQYSTVVVIVETITIIVVLTRICSTTTSTSTSAAPRLPVPVLRLSCRFSPVIPLRIAPA